MANFTFTSLPTPSDPSAIEMKVVDGSTSVIEMFPTHSLRASGDAVRFTANIVSSIKAGGGTSQRQIITVSSLTFFDGLLNTADSGRQAALTALINANAVCIYLSGAQAMTIPDGWYRVNSASIAANTITISTYSNDYTAITASGGAIDGDTNVMFLSRPEMGGAYFHAFTGGADGAATEPSAISIDGSTPLINVGFRQLRTLLTSAKII